MRFPLTSVVAAIVIGTGAIGASPCSAQTRMTSLDELRRALAAGDVIKVVPEGGQPVSGRLMRIGDTDLDVRPTGKRNPRERALADLTLRLDSIQSLERFRDPVRNGTAVGAGIGAGIGAAMFITALVVDRNEVDEWAGFYAGATAAFAGIGALVGWAVDAAKSRPHIRYEMPSRDRHTITVLPFYSRGTGIVITLSFTP